MSTHEPFEPTHVITFTPTGGAPQQRTAVMLVDGAAYDRVEWHREVAASWERDPDTGEWTFQGNAAPGLGEVCVQPVLRGMVDTAGNHYPTRDAYHVALRPLKSRGGRTVRISVGAFLYRGSRWNGELRDGVAVRLLAPDGCVAASHLLWCRERFEALAINRLGTPGAYIPVWPSPEQVAEAIDRLLLESKPSAATTGGV